MRGHSEPNKCTRRKIWNSTRLDRASLQLNNTELGLQVWHSGHLYARIYKVSNPQFPSTHPKPTPELPPSIEPPKLWIHSIINDTIRTWISQARPPQIQNSATSCGNFIILSACGLTHDDISIEHHQNRTRNHHTSHGQSSDSADKLCCQILWGHNKISRKWNYPPYPQQRLLPVRDWIPEYSRRTSLPQRGISRVQKGPTKSTAIKWTSSCQMHNHEKITSYHSRSITGSPIL